MFEQRKHWATVAFLTCWLLAGPASLSADDQSSSADRVHSVEHPLAVESPLAVENPLAVEKILGAIQEPELVGLLVEILERNPAVAEAEARARAVSRRAVQARALPEPAANVTAFLESPETRVGPQVVSVGFFQGLPWPGKLALKEKAVLLEAAALGAGVQAKRLHLVTQARRLLHELAFVARHREIIESSREHLVQHEEIARGRYSTGAGLGQAVVKLHTEITRVDKVLLDLEIRRLELIAQLNVLRARPADAEVPEPGLGQVEEVFFDRNTAYEQALQNRPELVAADLLIARAETRGELAGKANRPDFKVGLMYTVVDGREDQAGRLQPPEGNGDDIIAIQGGITVPLWRGRINAGVEEAGELHRGAIEARRLIAAKIEVEVGDVLQRLPLSWRQLRLTEDLLIIQADESLESAQAGYISGALNALDLLDAEHLLFDAETAVARAKADYLIGITRLEGAMGGPVR